MDKSKTGLIAGSILGAIGLTYALKDRKMRNKMAKDGHKMMNKASNLLEKMDIM